MASELRAILNRGDSFSLRSLTRDVAELLGIDRVRAAVVVGSQSGAARPVAVQAVDRRGKPKTGRFLILVYAQMYLDDDWQGPGGAMSISAPSAGAVVATLSALKSLVCVTAADGSLRFTVTGASGEPGMLVATVLGEAATSERIDWS